MGGLGHGVNSKKNKPSGILDACGWCIRASNVGASEDQGCSCPVILQIVMEVSSTPWLLLLKVHRCLLGQHAGCRGCIPIFSFPVQPKPENAITIAVSSRALFRMEEEQKIYSEQGVEAYVKYQLDHENEPFLPGAAFPFVKVSIHLPELRLRCGPEPKDLGRRGCCGVLAWGSDGE